MVQVRSLERQLERLQGKVVEQRDTISQLKMDSSQLQRVLRNLVGYMLHSIHKLFLLTLSVSVLSLSISVVCLDKILFAKPLLLVFLDLKNRDGCELI